MGKEGTGFHAIVEEEELRFDYGFEVEENSPAASIAHEIGRQSSIQALNWSLILEKGAENSEGVDGS